MDTEKRKAGNPGKPRRPAHLILDKHLCIRMTADIYDGFMAKASKYDAPATVAREILKAYAEGRIVIKRSDETTIYD